MKLDVRINRLTPGDGKVKALASATLDDCFAVKNIRILEGSKGLFISMPSFKAQDGTYRDICFPTTAEFRQTLNSAIIDAYHQSISQLQEQIDRPFATAEQSCDEPVSAMEMSV